MRTALSTIESIGLVGTVLGILAFLIQYAVRPLWKLVSKTQEPRRLAQALRALQCDVQLQTFTDALGQPPKRSGGNHHL